MFESTLNVSSGSGRSLGKGALFSAVTHAAVVLLVIRASAHAQAAKPEAPEVMFQVAAPPPPPPPLGGHAESRTEAPKKPRITPSTSVLHEAKPQPAPDPTPATEAVGEPDGQVGGQAGGVKTGLLGGEVNGTGTALPRVLPVVPPPPPPGPPTSSVLAFGEGMNRPRLLEGPEPAYPNAARVARVEGTLLARCVITTDGALQGCRIIKSLPFLDQPVLEALARRRYTPVTFQGRAVAVEYVIPFKFQLP